MMKRLLPPYSVLSGVNENICAFLLVFSRREEGGVRKENRLEAKERLGADRRIGRICF